MSQSRHLRKSAIQAFQIPSGGQRISPEEWAKREPEAVWYGLPIEGEYNHPDGRKFRRCHVEAFKEGGASLGFLPLPHRYAEAWVQLCYSVVYWMSTWKAWVGEVGKMHRVRQQPQDLVEDGVNNSGTRFLKYLVIRRMIVDELLRHPMSSSEDDELDVFDEYLIRDRFDWLWSEIDDIPEIQEDYLGLDPVHEKNKGIFSKCVR
jgi:hypothetical protein